MTHTQLVFVAGKRTPFGAFGGSFKSLTATDLAVIAARATLNSLSESERAIDHVIFGNVMQSSSDAAYLARHVGLRCGLSESIPAVTVNRLCGSGFEAIADGARRLLLQEATTVLCGGTESMSQAPFVLRDVRFGHRLGPGELEDSLVAGLTDSFAKLPMALTAENLAERYHLSREACDAFALRSQKSAWDATQAGRFREEITPVTVTEKGKTREVTQDEHIRKDASLENLAKLKPVFKKDGVVTAGNASGMVDGACAVILTTKEKAQKEGWPILGELHASHVVGCDPKVMGIGPVPAIQALLSKTSKRLSDIALIEVNEAFAPQTLAVLTELKLDETKLNVDGGAIAIGHPLGASGARLTLHLLHALKTRGGGWGIASACIGGGQGMALLLKV